MTKQICIYALEPLRGEFRVIRAGHLDQPAAAVGGP
jgi:hypothetical protein